MRTRLSVRAGGRDVAVNRVAIFVRGHDAVLDLPSAPVRVSDLVCVPSAVLVTVELVLTFWRVYWPLTNAVAILFQVEVRPSKPVRLPFTVAVSPLPVHTQGR